MHNFMFLTIAVLFQGAHSSRFAPVYPAKDVLMKILVDKIHKYQENETMEAKTKRHQYKIEPDITLENTRNVNKNTIEDYYKKINRYFPNRRISDASENYRYHHNAQSKEVNAILHYPHRSNRKANRQNQSTQGNIFINNHDRNISKTSCYRNGHRCDTARNIRRNSTVKDNIRKKHETPNNNIRNDNNGSILLHQSGNKEDNQITVSLHNIQTSDGRARQRHEFIDPNEKLNSRNLVREFTIVPITMINSKEIEFKGNVYSADGKNISKNTNLDYEKDIVEEHKTIDKNLSNETISKGYDSGEDSQKIDVNKVINKIYDSKLIDEITEILSQKMLNRLTNNVRTGQTSIEDVPRQEESVELIEIILDPNYSTPKPNKKAKIGIINGKIFE